MGPGSRDLTMQVNPISLPSSGDSLRGLSGILGALVGDALGVPFEFKTPEQIPSPDMIEMLMPEWFRKTYAAIPYGTWSDDGSQLLCLFENMITHREFVPGHFGELLMRWYGDARHQAGGHVFDCGGQTARAIRNLEAGIAPLECGGRDDRSNGNGSLMRVLPVVVVGRRLGWGREKLISVAHDQSRVTHAHPVSQVCCALYVLVASDLLDRPALSAAEVLNQASNFLMHFYRNSDQPQHSDALVTIMAYPDDQLVDQHLGFSLFKMGPRAYIVRALTTRLDQLLRLEIWGPEVREPKQFLINLAEAPYALRQAYREEMLFPLGVMPEVFSTNLETLPSGESRRILQFVDGRQAIVLGPELY